MELPFDEGFSPLFSGRRDSAIGRGASASSLVKAVILGRDGDPRIFIDRLVEDLYNEQTAFRAGLPVEPLFEWMDSAAEYAEAMAGDPLPKVALRIRREIRLGGYKSKRAIKDLLNTAVKIHKQGLKNAAKEIEREGEEQLKGADEPKYLQTIKKFYKEDSFYEKYDYLAKLRFIRNTAKDAPYKWGPVRKLTPDLFVPRKQQKKIARNFRIADQGESLGEIWRVATDGEVFRDIRPTLGGSLLIDCSGSMSLSPDVLKEIIYNAPHVTIAKYAADCSAGEMIGLFGYIQIVAKKGRIARDEELERSLGGMNLIDGPALRWLAKQRSPRVWFSDGHVTVICPSSGEALNNYAKQECNQICKLFKIYRTTSIDELIEVFKPKKGH